MVKVRQGPAITVPAIWPLGDQVAGRYRPARRHPRGKDDVVSLVMLVPVRRPALWATGSAASATRRANAPTANERPSRVIST
jgi:hypothetical protein